MPLSLWGLDDVRKGFNDRVDKTGAAAWNTARGRKPKDEDGTRRSEPVRGTSTAGSSAAARFPPPPRKLSAQDLPPPPRTPSVGPYDEARTRKPPPPPPTSKPDIAKATVPPPLPRRPTTGPSPQSDEGSAIRPSTFLGRARPPLPAAIKRNDSQDGVTNEFAEKLAKMRTRSSSPEKPVVPPVQRIPSSTPLPPKPSVGTKPAVSAPKPSLPPRTTPVPSPIPLISHGHSRRPPPLPYKPSPLHKCHLPEFDYPPPDPATKSPGLEAFNRAFPTPLWELEQASLFILSILYPSDDAYTFTPKTLDGCVSLIMKDFHGNAHAENSAVIIMSGKKKAFKWRSNLVFSTRNLTAICSQGMGDSWFVGEVRGVIIHELTHSWQWSCNDTPSGLIEGARSLLSRD
jgi:Peptidase of plants and bacteria